MVSSASNNKLTTVFHVDGRLIAFAKAIRAAPLFSGNKPIIGAETSAFDSLKAVHEIDSLCSESPESCDPYFLRNVVVSELLRFAQSHPCVSTNNASSLAEKYLQYYNFSTDLIGIHGNYLALGNLMHGWWRTHADFAYDVLGFQERKQHQAALLFSYFAFLLLQSHNLQNPTAHLTLSCDEWALAKTSAVLDSSRQVLRGIGMDNGVFRCWLRDQISLKCKYHPDEKDPPGMAHPVYGPIISP